MSHGFKLKYDQMRDNASEAKPDSPSGIERYEAPSRERKLSFILADGSRIRLNYGYLVSEEFIPEKNMIVLAFTSHTVTLSGQHLEKLYEELELCVPRIIASVDARYNMADESETAIVNTIHVESKTE